jgi:hypothetical protein
MLGPAGTLAQQQVLVSCFGGAPRRYACCVCSAALCWRRLPKLTPCGAGWGGVVIDGPLRTASEFERRLSVGAMIACRLRGAVREQLGALQSVNTAEAFRCS